MQNSPKMFSFTLLWFNELASEVFYIPCTWIQKTAAQVQYLL